MRKLFIAIILAIALFLSFVTPALADAPTIENWTSNTGGGASSGFFINTTTLQVQSFWIQNDSPFARRLRIIQRGDLIFEMISPAYSGYMEEPISGFKWQRKPATDPDDPNSVSPPPNTSVFFDYP